MTTATINRPYDVPQSGGNGRAIVLAIAMHLLLAALLFFGVRWQSSAPEVVQAELWSAVPQTAAPPPRPAVIQPAPPKVEVPVPKVVEPDPPPVKAAIVEKTPKAAPPKKKEVVKVEAPKPQVRPQPPVPVQKAPPKPSQDVRRLLEQATAETQRPPSDVNSLIAAAGREGKDQQTSGPRGDASGYAAKLVAAIRSQMRYPASAPGNPAAKIRIEQLPNGEVTNVTVTHPSGVQAFDDAIERAIRAASPLPRPTQGTPPRDFELTYNMYEKS